MLQFSDGVMEEYSWEDEVDMPKNNKTVSQIDTVIIQLSYKVKLVFLQRKYKIIYDVHIFL